MKADIPNKERSIKDIILWSISEGDSVRWTGLDIGKSKKSVI